MATEFTVGVGFTAIVKFFEVPLQVSPPFVKDGVTVIKLEIGEFVEFVAVNAAIFPVPFAPKPVVVFVFVQL